MDDRPLYAEKLAREVARKLRGDLDLVSWGGVPGVSYKLGGRNFLLHFQYGGYNTPKGDVAVIETDDDEQWLERGGDYTLTGHTLTNEFNRDLAGVLQMVARVVN